MYKKISVMLYILLLIFSLSGVEKNIVDDSEGKGIKKDSADTESTDQDTVEKEVVKESEDVPETDNVEQGYNLKLRNLEEKINSLKDKIFRSKQRLAILQETVLSGSIAGARATIVHKNKVGSAFKLVSVVYYLDEAPVYKKIDKPDDLKKDEIVVFDGSIVPGPHHLSVYFVFKGRGYYIFSYMKGYTFKMKAGHSFNVDEGNLMEITVTPKDKGSSVKIDNRLMVSFDVKKKMYEQKADKEEKDSE